jgi:HNH endonuclease
MLYEERIIDYIVKVDRGYDTLCWIWQPALNSHGYGQFIENGRYYQAHRYSYELFVGPIPDGHTVDHLCNQTDCENPDHLEAKTQGDNVRRSRHENFQAHANGTCTKGHELIDPYVKKRKNGTLRYQCRICVLDYVRERRGASPS